MSIPNPGRNGDHHPNSDGGPNARGSRRRQRSPNCQQPNTDKTQERIQALEVEGSREIGYPSVMVGQRF